MTGFSQQATGLVIPGWMNSGPEHWQSLWEAKLPDSLQRVQQKEWNEPAFPDWMAGLDAAIAGVKDKAILVAHSMGVILVAHWVATRDTSKIAGAFLVAPCDPNNVFGLPGFDSMPLVRFPFPTIVVASSNDDWVSAERAKHFAESWGGQLINIGEQGHINADSGFGPWPEGLDMLCKLSRAERE